MPKLIIIKQLAAEKGLTIQGIAKKVGISRQRLSEIINGGSTKHETLEKIAEVLSVPISTFFEEDQGKTISQKEKAATNIDSTKSLHKGQESIRELSKKMEQAEFHLKLLEEKVKRHEDLIDILRRDQARYEKEMESLLEDLENIKNVKGRGTQRPTG